MGYVLYTASGTFNPTAYGLSPGDALNLVLVGGGGAGYARNQNGNTAVGATGGTSSFGGIVSALGGAGGVAGTVPAMQGSSQGYTHIPNGENAWRNVVRAGPCGWMPGYQLTQVVGTQDYINSQINGVSSAAPYILAANSTTVYWTDVMCVSAGYGAGGAFLLHSSGSGSNVYYGTTGNAGEIIFYNHILTSTAAIAVTVGIGGINVVGATSVQRYAAGAGANGCIAIFW